MYDFWYLESFRSLREKIFLPFEMLHFKSNMEINFRNNFNQSLLCIFVASNLTNLMQLRQLRILADKIFAPMFDWKPSPILSCLCWSVPSENYWTFCGTAGKLTVRLFKEAIASYAINIASYYAIMENCCSWWMFPLGKLQHFLEMVNNVNVWTIMRLHFLMILYIESICKLENSPVEDFIGSY